MPRIPGSEKAMPEQHRSTVRIAADPIVKAYAIHIGPLAAKARNGLAFSLRGRLTWSPEIAQAFQSFAVSAAKPS